MATYSNIQSGVPQGSILGPTLFPLFVNDLPLFLKHSFCDLFADDATVHTSSTDLDTINEEISADLLQIIYWSKRNHQKAFKLFRRVYEALTFFGFLFGFKWNSVVKNILG